MIVLFMVVLYYWMCQSFLTGCVGFFVFFFFCFFFNDSFDLAVLKDFDLSLPVGDKFFQSGNSGTVSWLLGLDRIFK